MAEEKKEVLEAEQAPEQAAPTMEAVMHDPDAPIITMKKLLEAGRFYLSSFQIQFLYSP